MSTTEKADEFVDGKATRNGIAAFRPEELQSAVTLAAELYRQDRERQAVMDATAEVGVPPEYLVRALTTIQQRNEQRDVGSRSRRASLRNVTLSVLAIAALAAIVWPLALSWQPPALPMPTAALPPAGNAGTAMLPPTSAPTAPLKPLPVPAGNALTFRNLYRLQQATITFQNTLDQSVELYFVDYFNRRQRVNRIPPGGSMARISFFGLPWIATDEKGQDIGMYFMMSGPTKAVIERPSEAPLTVANLPEGYLKPTSVGNVLPPAPATTPESGMSGSIEFINMTGKELYLYLVGPSQKPAWVTPLAPYDGYLNTSAQAGTLWIVTDKDRQVLESFTHPRGFGVAVITPDVAR